MGCDWNLCKLEDVIEVNPYPELNDEGKVVYVGMADLRENARKIDAYELREYPGSGSRFQNNDTLLARITPCLENGKTAYVDLLSTDNAIAWGSTEFIVLRARPNISDDLFVYYLARDPDFRNYAIQRMEGTSGRQRVPTISVEQYKFLLPPLPEQRAIAHILGSLDDKIELNRRMNATLEGIARALFKSWFVDFDPVHVRRGESESTLPPEVLALFPDEFVESELGLIPKGWKVVSALEEFDVNLGQSPPGSTYNEEGEGMPFFQGSKDFAFRYPEYRIYCTEPKRLAQPNDTLISVRAPVGDVNMAFEKCCIGRGLWAVRHKSGSRSYTYYAMKKMKEYFDRFNAEGTVFGSLSKRKFKRIPVLSPAPVIVDRFEQLIAPVDEVIENNMFESRTLAELRDTLLPRLISGELRVPERLGQD